jgi:hypothetical protein
MRRFASNWVLRPASTARAAWRHRSAALALALVAAATVTGCDPGDLPRTQGCDDVRLRPILADTAARGPWTVGVRTVTMGEMEVEVWYPAGQFDESETPPVFYDLRDQLPPSERRRISDQDAPLQPCDCYRNVPLDRANGPYPVVLFLHGRGGFRTQSLPQMLHWASRGFVVIAADHPGTRLADVLSPACGGPTVLTNLRGDVEAILGAVRTQGDGFGFMRGHIDASRVAIAGHSTGGMALESMGDLAQVLIPMAAGGVEPGRALESTLVLGGTADAVVPYARQRRGYVNSPPPKRLVGLANAGHLAFSTICTITNAAGQGLGQIAVEAGVCGASLLVSQMQCSPQLLPEPEAWEIIDAVTAAVLEETLHCDAEAARTFETLRTDYSAVAELRESP